tara:strand:+ start:1497 stop:1670 length:174 start_codon:yes stop_codon:yes gene_type:complete
MEITSAQYIEFDGEEVTTIKATIDGKISFVPMSNGNIHYAEILRQVKAGELTIKDAD